MTAAGHRCRRRSLPAMVLTEMYRYLKLYIDIRTSLQVFADDVRGPQGVAAVGRCLLAMVFTGYLKILADCISASPTSCLLRGVWPCRCSKRPPRRGGRFEYRHASTRAIDMPSAMPMYRTIWNQSTSWRCPLAMVFNGYLKVFADIYRLLQIFLDVHRYSQAFIDVHRYS